MKIIRIAECEDCVFYAPDEPYTRGWCKRCLRTIGTDPIPDWCPLEDSKQESDNE